MAGNADDSDAGWLSPKFLRRGQVPGIEPGRSQAEAGNALHVLRILFIAFATALGLIGIVVVFLSTGDQADSTMSATVVAAGVVAYGFVTLTIPRLVEPALDCSSPETLVDGYRTRFFLRIGYADSAALIGFVGFFLSGDWWLYPLGAFFSLIGFIRLAPTRRNLERDQEALNSSGCGLSLVDALTST